NMKTAAELYKSAFGGRSGGPSQAEAAPQAPALGRGQGLKFSHAGALLNQGRAMDRKATPPATGGSANGSAGQGSTGGHENRAFDTILNKPATSPGAGTPTTPPPS